MLERMLVDVSTRKAWGHWRQETGQTDTLQVDVDDLDVECAAMNYEANIFEETRMVFGNLAEQSDL